MNNTDKSLDNALTFLLNYMREHGAVGRDKAISYQQLENSHHDNLGKPGFGYHSYAGLHVDDGPAVEYLLCVALDRGVIAGRDRNEEEPEIFDTFYIEAN